MSGDEWAPDDEWGRFMAEHSYSAHISGGEMVIEFGDPGLVPALPGTFLCAHCDTPIQERGEAGWRHDWSAAVRGGCLLAEPRSSTTPTTKEPQ